MGFAKLKINGFKRKNDAVSHKYTHVFEKTTYSAMYYYRNALNII